MIKLTRPPCPNQSALQMGDYKHTNNKMALQEASFHKCMYCESKVSQVYFADIEHIKPKSRYPQYAFDWENLGYVCAICNGKKSDRFNEATPYINPYDEDPGENLLALGAFIRQKQGSERGEITICDIDLNRAALIERRKVRLEALEKAINACFRTHNETLKENALFELKKEGDFDKEYSMCAKALLMAQEIYD